MKKLLALALMSAALASCTLTPEQQVKSEKIYNTICDAAPPLYALYLVSGQSPAKVRKAGALFESVKTLCTNRPTDLVAGAVTLSIAYAQFVAATR